MFDDQNQPKYQIRKAKNFDTVYRSAKWHVFESNQAFFLTEAELRTRLERKTDVVEWIDQAIDKLKQYNYVKSDTDFADDFIEKAYFGDYGAGYIIQTLQKKGLDRKLITSRIDAFKAERHIDEQEILNNYINSYYQVFGNNTKEKLINRLTKRGFTQAQADNAIKQHPDFPNLKTNIQAKAEKTDIEKELIKMARKGKGLKAIKATLQAKQVDIRGIDQLAEKLTMDETIDFYTSCVEVLNKKDYDLSDFKQRSKAYAFLAQRGFDSEQIKFALSECEQKDD